MWRNGGSSFSLVSKRVLGRGSEREPRLCLPGGSGPHPRLDASYSKLVDGQTAARNTVPEVLQTPSELFGKGFDPTHSKGS